MPSDTVADSTSNKHPLLRRILLSVMISSFLLLGIWWLASSLGSMEGSVTFKQTIQNTVWWLASFYILTALLQTLLRALRYRSLLKADGIKYVPGTGYMFLVTLCRNMFVDMVPARLGEASYVIMLNRAYKVPVSAGLSTLFISMVLDMLALSILLVFLVVISLFSSSLLEMNLSNLLAVSSFIVITAGIFIYAAVPLSRWFLRVMNLTGSKILKKFGSFIVEVGSSIQRVQMKELLSLTMMQSLGIRIFKYSGLYILFLAVTTASFPGFAALPLQQVLPAFVSAEAAASLPLPTFMSFGTYEGGGMLAFVMQGFDASDILMVMFVIHLLSQAVDYTLGILGLLGFVFVTRRENS